jgi:hypothetical protein
MPGVPLHGWERMAEAVAGVARAGVAKANASMADANAPAKEAELKLVQLRTPAGLRSLNHEAFVGELEGKPNARLAAAVRKGAAVTRVRSRIVKVLLRIPLDDPDRRRIPARARIVELGTVRHDDEGGLFGKQLDEVTRC